MTLQKGDTSKSKAPRRKDVKSRQGKSTNVKTKGGNSKPVKSQPVQGGFMLFRNEYVANLGEKKKKMTEESKAAGKAWRELPDDKKKEYTERAKQARPERKKSKIRVSFHTRCSLRGFTSLVEFVNQNEDLKERVRRIGFGNLLKVELDRLPHDLIVSILRAYDPPTHQFRIRGKTQEIEAKDVEKLLGITCKGVEVRVDVEDSDPLYEKLKSEYGKKKYTDILKDIKSGENRDKFEFRFVLYTLGVFLCPHSSGVISDRMLRVMCCTMEGFEKYDWATYMIKELWKEMSDYIKVYRKKNEREGTCNVGGCLYLLLLFFAENFPLKQSVKHESTTPIEFWTKEKINDMVNNERMSNMGILYQRRGSEVRAANEDAQEMPYLDPELRDLYARLMEVIDEHRKRLISVVVDELTKVQNARERRGKAQPNSPVVTVDDGDGEEDKASDDDDDERVDADEEEGGNDDANVEGVQVGDEGDSGKGPNEGDDESLSPLNISPLSVSGQDEGDGGRGGSTVDKPEQPRRSKRQQKRAITSPFVELQVGRKRKRPTDDQETFFNIVSRLAIGPERDV